MKAGVAHGQLMFTLADGSSISCPCIGEPYASQIAAEIEMMRGALNVVKVYIHQNPLGDALVVPKGTKFTGHSDLSRYPSLRKIVDDAIGMTPSGLDSIEAGTVGQ